MNFGFSFHRHVALLRRVFDKGDIRSLLIGIDIEEQQVVSLSAVGVHQVPSIFKLLFG